MSWSDLVFDQVASATILLLRCEDTRVMMISSRLKKHGKTCHPFLLRWTCRNLKLLWVRLITRLAVWACRAAWALLPPWLANHYLWRRLWLLMHRWFRAVCYFEVGCLVYIEWVRFSCSIISQWYIWDRIRFLLNYHSLFGHSIARWAYEWLFQCSRLCVVLRADWGSRGCHGPICRQHFLVSRRIRPWWSVRI